MPILWRSNVGPVKANFRTPNEAPSATKGLRPLGVMIIVGRRIALLRP